MYSEIGRFVRENRPHPVNGVRIKTIIGKQGTVTGASYTQNALANVKNAIVIHSDYSKDKGGYTGDASRLVEITDITVAGLSGIADNVYDILVNPKAISGWTFSGITVKELFRVKLLMGVNLSTTGVVSISLPFEFIRP